MPRKFERIAVPALALASCAGDYLQFNKFEK